jgi:hypothetical protein
MIFQNPCVCQVFFAKNREPAVAFPQGNENWWAAERERAGLRSRVTGAHRAKNKMNSSAAPQITHICCAHPTREEEHARWALTLWHSPARFGVESVPLKIIHPRCGRIDIQKQSVVAFLHLRWGPA